MYENSKIISLAMSFVNGLEKAYRNSHFCKQAKKLNQNFKNIWKDSGFGQIMDNTFNVETHSGSLSYKLFTKSFLALMDFIYDWFSLEQGISNSSYINIIRSLGLYNQKLDKNESFVKTMFKDSIFMKCLYQFWEGMD